MSDSLKLKNGYLYTLTLSVKALKEHITLQTRIIDGKTERMLLFVTFLQSCSFHIFGSPLTLTFLPFSKVYLGKVSVIHLGLQKCTPFDLSMYDCYTLSNLWAVINFQDTNLFFGRRFKGNIDI